MRLILAVFVSGLLAASAAAQPWYARGDWNTHGLTDPMVHQGGIHWTADVTGFFPDLPQNFKIAEEDWIPEMPGIGPGHDARIYTDAAGELHFHLYDQESWDDGWFPNNVRRIGYNDHQQFDWEIVGSFNGWPGAHDPNFSMTDQGNGLHRGTFTFDTGIYNFKFRGVEADIANAWDTTIGQTFDNAAADNTFAVLGDDQEWIFELDLPNGRFRYFTEDVPTLVGDHNSDGSVDAADYVLWRKDPGTYGGAQGYTDWRNNFGETGGGPLTWIARSPQLGDETMEDAGDGLYTQSYTGLTAQTDYDFTVLRSDASVIIPSNNMRVRADINGEIDLNLHDLDGASWGDGWNPASTDRVGYEDHNEFDWEIMGDFPESAWTTPLVQLTDQGDGLHTGTVTIATPGSYNFKFRQQGDWTTSIGADFGNNAPNAPLTTASANELWHFELDLPNGRWRAYLDGSGLRPAVPEPASILLALVACFAACGVTRRR